MNPIPRRRWLDYAAAAEYLGCTERQLKRWVAQRRIAHTKLGLQVLFSPKPITLADVVGYPTLAERDQALALQRNRKA